MHPGPTTSAIRQECTLELVAIRKGSTTLQFGWAKPQIPLPFGDESVAFGVEVVGELASAIKSLGNGNRKPVDDGVLNSIYSLASVVEAKNVDTIEWIVPGRGSGRKIAGKVDRTVRDRIATRLSKPRRIRTMVDGVLDMADFKPKDMKCRIDPPIGASITCAFLPELGDRVYSLMRKPVRASGEAVMQPYTDRIDLLQIETIDPLPSLALGEGNFFTSSSIADLAHVQKVKPLKDLSVLAGAFESDEDVDRFLDEIYSARR